MYTAWDDLIQKPKGLQAFEDSSNDSESVFKEVEHIANQRS